MPDVRPILDYAQAPRKRTWPWQALAALPLLMFVPATMCICGHMDWFSLASAAPATFLAGWGLSRRDLSLIWRLILILIVTLSSLALAKGAGDILRFGHEPLLGAA